MDPLGQRGRRGKMDQVVYLAAKGYQVQLDPLVKLVPVVPSDQLDQMVSKEIEDPTVQQDQRGLVDRED